MPCGCQGRDRGHGPLLQDLSRRDAAPTRRRSYRIYRGETPLPQDAAPTGSIAAERRSHKTPLLQEQVFPSESETADPHQ